MSTRRRSPRIASVSLAALAWWGCSDGPSGPGSATASIVVVSGSSQRGPTGARLRVPIRVRVLDSGGNTIAGAEARFQTGANDGRAEPSSTLTDGAGEASTEWTLGILTGPQALTVSAGGVSTVVEASAFDLDAEISLLFQPATPGEVNQIWREWSLRDAGAQSVRVEHSEMIPLGGHSATLRVISHTVGGNRHYGGLLLPSPPDGGSPPRLLLYMHGGDGGVAMEDVITIADWLGEELGSVLWVVPSFRSEPLRWGGLEWTSEGAPSPWDFDVDDAMALADAALAVEPSAQSNGFGVVGFSRGGGVGLLAGVRDPRIDRLVAFFGPTDFFDPWVQLIVREAILGMPRALPGVAALDSLVILPWLQGRVSFEDARLELVRRSPVLFGESLPMVQLHHGDADPIVPVSQAESMIAAMNQLGIGPPRFQAFIYPGAGHHPLGMEGAIERSVEFLAPPDGN